MGKDATIFANGHMVSRALEAVAALGKKGVDARLVDIHTIKPLDIDLVSRCAAETGAVVTVEEHLIAGGMGSAISEVLATQRPTPIEMVGIRDTFAETALDHNSLLDKYGMSVDNIVEAAERAVRRKKTVR